MSTDELFMRRAIELARNGAGRVSPNPMVGCVIARDGNVVGEGWHRDYGGPHAEVHAVNSVPDPALLRGSTVYVNLEPCSHQGKTPPCAGLLVRSAVGRVVVANADPNPLVAGRGLGMLRQAGISVESGLLAEEGEALNARFFTFHRLKRPTSARSTPRGTSPSPIGRRT
jgi:diaminohydroxyphosphoribosylaminopyrimidine deaminase / 5-amino-6-(5-phosphoribosylamino)uracil reductase